MPTYSYTSKKSANTLDCNRVQWAWLRWTEPAEQGFSTEVSDRLVILTVHPWISTVHHQISLPVRSARGCGWLRAPILARDDRHGLEASFAAIPDRLVSRDPRACRARQASPHLSTLPSFCQPQQTEALGAPPQSRRALRVSQVSRAAPAIQSRSSCGSVPSLCTRDLHLPTQ
jgi:hypothetical protein